MNHFDQKSSQQQIRILNGFNMVYQKIKKAEREVNKNFTLMTEPREMLNSKVAS